MRANLGKCHWGGFEEAAELMAVDQNKVGWVAVCNNHRQDAERDGYHVRELNDEVATYGSEVDEDRDVAQLDDQGGDRADRGGRGGREHRERATAS